MQRTLQGTLSKNCSSVGKMSSADFLFLLLYIAALGERGGKEGGEGEKWAYGQTFIGSPNIY